MFIFILKRILKYLDMKNEIIIDFSSYQNIDKYKRFDYSKFSNDFKRELCTFFL